jgi:hypothetical protein
VLAAIAVFAGLLHQVSYLMAMPFQVAADIPDAVSYDPGEPVIVALYLVAAVLLLRGTASGCVTRSMPGPASRDGHRSPDPRRT